MRTVLKLGVAAAIVASAYWAIVRVAEEKANALAGGHTFVLDQRSPEEWEAFATLRGRLREWGEPDLATALVRLQESGDLWVAPGLEGGRSAIFVRTLRLKRIFVRRDELVAHDLPFPDLDIPESAQRTFETIRLAGTLFHELQHYEGLEDETTTYQREIRWYTELRERVLEHPSGGEERRLFEWAVDSAIKSATAAREKAGGSGREW